MRRSPEGQKGKEVFDGKKGLAQLLSRARASARHSTERRSVHTQTQSCAKCGKLRHLRVACRSSDTHEEHEPAPLVGVEEVRCGVVRDVVRDGCCDCAKLTVTTRNTTLCAKLSVQNMQRDPAHENTSRAS